MENSSNNMETNENSDEYVEISENYQKHKKNSENHDIDLEEYSDDKNLKRDKKDSDDNDDDDDHIDLEKVVDSDTERFMKPYETSSKQKLHNSKDRVRTNGTKSLSENSLTRSLGVNNKEHGEDYRLNKKTSLEVNPKTSPGVNHKTSPGVNHKTSPGINHKTSPGINHKTSPEINPKTSPGIIPTTSIAINPKTSPGINHKASPENGELAGNGLKNKQVKDGKLGNQQIQGIAKRTSSVVEQFDVEPLNEDCRKRKLKENEPKVISQEEIAITPLVKSSHNVSLDFDPHLVLKREESSHGGLQMPSGKDSGYGWLVVFAAFTINATVAGYMKSFGLLYGPINLMFPNTSAATAGLMMGLLNGCRGILAPVAGAFSNFVGPRVCSLIGAILAASGLLLAVPGISPIYLAFTIGALVGVGVCLGETPGYIIVSEYFLEKRATANGIRSAGNAFGGVAFPFFVTFILGYYPLQGCFIILAGSMLQIAVLGMLFRPFPIHRALVQREFLEQHRQTLDRQDKQLILAESKLDKETLTKQNKKKPLNFSLLKNPAYIIYIIFITLCNIAVPNVLMYLPLFGRYKGLNELEISSILSIVSIVDFFSRIFLGWLSDKKIYAKRHAFIFGNALAGVSLLLLPLGYNMWTITLFMLGRCLGISTFWSLINSLLADQFGSENIATSWGFFRMVQGITNFLYPPLLGVAADKTGSMETPYIIMGSMQLLAAFIFSLQPLVIRITGIDVKLT